MSETVLDDRDSAITYVDGVWRKGGNSREYQETTSWSNSNEATATIDFYGNSIRVIGTIHQRDGVPANATLNLAFVLQGETSSTIIAQNRAMIDQTHPPTYGVQLYSSPQLADNSVKRQLVIRNLTPDNLGFLCLDAVYIGGYTTGPRPGQLESDPSPSSSASTSSPPTSLPSTVTTSASPESSSTISAPNTTTSIIPSASSASNSVLFAPAATDASSSLDEGSGNGSSSHGGSNQADSKGEGSSSRPVVTGVLGGLVGLLALGILGWFIFVRRRNRRRRKALGHASEDQQQTFTSPYSFGNPGNGELAPSAAGSETHLLNATGRSKQNAQLPPLAAGTRMREVFGGSGGSIGGPGLSPVSGPITKSAWNGSSTSQLSTPPFAGNSVDSPSRHEDDSVLPPPYTTHVQ